MFEQVRWAGLGVVAVMLAAMLSGCGTMRIEERVFIHPDQPAVAGAQAPPRQQGAPQGVAAALPGAHINDTVIALEAGATLRGIELDQAGARTTILYFGGNAFHLDAHAQFILPALAACHANVVMYDYRGYGRSDGAPTVRNMQQDALRIYDSVNARHPGQVVVHGQSLGSFVAAYVAQHRPVAALVLESTTSNARDWANANVPWYAKPFITVEIGDTLKDIDNVAAVAGYAGPALVLVGERDKITPPVFARQVYAAMPGAGKRLVVSAGAGHNDVIENAATAAAYCDFIGALAPAAVARAP